MFRFIGLVWQPGSDSSSPAASTLSLSLQAHPDWEVALRRHGLEVFVAGALPGINQAHCLQGRHGAVLGKLFRRELLGQSPQPEVALNITESAELVRTGGRLLIDEFWGRYVAFLHARAGHVSVLRDPSGSLPCYVMRHHDMHIVFSWLEDVLTVLPQVPPPRVSREGLAAQFAFGELTGHATALEGVTQILPGERMDIGRDTSTRIHLWSAIGTASEQAHMEVGAAASALRETVRACVQSWASCYDAVLLRLSGGVDSSILLSCLAEGQTQARVTCVNYHSPGADSDERPYARLAAGMARRELIECLRDPDFDLERALEVARTPTPSSYVGRTSARMDAELASSLGAPAMFTGGGGDQLLFEFHEWWPAADYLRLHGLGSGFARAAMDAARLSRVSVWKAMRLAWADRLRRGLPLLEAHKHWTLIADLVRTQATRPEAFVHPSLLAANDLPIGKLSQALQLVYSAGYYDPYERAAAPELVNPLLSQPIIELCLRLPTYVLTCGGRGRGLARQAFVQDLPAEIVSRRTKGGMEAHVQSLLLRNLDFARQVLLDGELVRLGILDRIATEKALSGPPNLLHSRIGELHMCLGIEAWLRRWPAPAPRAAP